MDVNTIRDIDAMCRRRFVYLADTIDTWRSHLAEVNAGKSWYGDCDDLVSTVLDALGHRRLPLTRRYRLLVSTTGSNTVDHMVGAARDARGTLWCIGDTFGATYLLRQMPHRALLYQRLDIARSTTWYTGAPN